MKNATAATPAVATAASGRSSSSKRQQQLYSPGSGPLRKTESSTSNRSLSSNQPGEGLVRPALVESGFERCRSPSGDLHQPLSWADKPSEQRTGRTGNNTNLRRDGMSSPVNSKGPRPESESRNVSSNGPGTRSVRPDRTMRDTRSVEPRFMTNSKKPPIPTLTHLENLPPRLQKKTLQDLGLPPNYVEVMRAEQVKAMSQTLPNRSSSRHSRGRLRYSAGSGGTGGSYYSNYGARPSGGRQMNEEYQSRPRSRSSDIGSEEGYVMRRGPATWDRRNPPETGPSSRNSSCERWDRGNYRRRDSLDWADDDGMDGRSEDYGNARWQGSVDLDLNKNPPAVKVSQHSGKNSNRQRNRSNSRSRNDFYDDFKVPYQPQRGTNRSRRNSQSSNVSREDSSERGYARGSRGSRTGPPSGQYRDTSHDRYYEGGVGGRFRRHSRDRYVSRSRDSSVDRGWADPEVSGNSWRNRPDEGPNRVDRTDRAIAEMTQQFECSIGIQKAPGVLIVPSRLSSAAPPSSSTTTKFLFDPKNPSQPILVKESQSRLGANHHQRSRDGTDRDEFQQDGGRFEGRNRRQPNSGGPAWYDPDSKQAKLLRQRELVHYVAEADAQLQELLDGGHLFAEWPRYVHIRQELQELLETFLKREMRFAIDVNLEHHFWKLLFYNIIERLRRQLAETQDESNKKYFQELAFEVVENGTAYFEKLLAMLESEYRFSLHRFVGVNAATSTKGLPYSLALVSAQKIFLFLGDLARYREQIIDGQNFHKAKQWYVKAQQILPKNGRPYNQLALLSVYARRKIDAVYFYMRSLMSSNPFESARESLMDLFNETKKKFESNQRKREEKRRAKRKEKEQRFDGLRREIWIHPEGGSRVHRTGPLHPFVGGSSADTSDDEELSGMCAIDLNKRFIVSFLHVLGKLITKTGMESFTQCAHQMLREFRALMQFAPIAVPSHRLLQLMSLNMFAIEMCKLKDAPITAGSRTELQDCALSSGLLMFGILLERLICLIREDLATEPAGTRLVLPEDAKVILPAIKVWCDWMMSNVEIWNPPPSCAGFKFGKSSAHDPWSELAVLMNMLKSLDTNRGILSVERKDGYETVRLQEDITLAGFTPLMYNEPEPIFVHGDHDQEEAENVLRVQKLLYFGTNHLCNCDPPVLRREVLPDDSTDGTTRYVSVVQTRNEGLSDMDILLEMFSDGEVDILDGDDAASQPTAVQPIVACASSSTDSGILSGSNSNSPSSLETRKLLHRKDELERKHRMQEKHNQRLQDILSQSTIAVSIEVHPRFLVPDTNCFVDYLPGIELIARAHPLYQLMVPIIVINELEGLSKGVRHQSPKHQAAVISSVTEMIVGRNLSLPTAPAGGDAAVVQPPAPVVAGYDLQHVAKVAEASKKALQFIKSRNPAVKCVTTKGSVLKTSTFTVEDDAGEIKSNDDRILETVLNLSRNQTQETRADTRYITLDVVLLTTDRNLRVKAISNDLPVRELPDFIKWAGLSA